MPIAPTPVTAGPPVPDSGVATPTFDAAYELFNAWEKNDLQPGMNQLAQDTFDNAVEAAASAATATTQAGIAATQAGNAQTSASASAASAASAVNAPGTSGTSATSLTLGAGTQTFSTQTGKAWVVGQPVNIARTSAPAASVMCGTITAYDSATGAMSVLVPADYFLGAGTFTDWTISLAGQSLPLKTVGGVSLIGPGNIAVDAFAIGDVITSTQAPTAGTWLPINAGTYLQSSYAALYSKIGLLADIPNNAGVWTTRTAPSAAAWKSVAYGNGVFVAIAGGPSASAATSPDGITWTARTLPSSSDWWAVTFGGGLFVAVSQTTGTVAATSPDGITWTARTLPTSANWRGVTWGNGLFVAVSQTSAAASSPDGITWTARTLPVNQVYLAVAYGAGVFVAVAGSTSASTSPDGITWTTRTLPVGGVNYNCIAFGLDTFIAGTNGGQTVKSTDGINWTTGTTTVSMIGLAFGGGVFVGTQVGSTVAYSKDAGVTWTAGSALPSSSIWAVAFGGDKFVVAGNGVSSWSSSSALFSFNVATQFALPAPVATPIKTMQYIKAL